MILLAWSINNGHNDIEDHFTIHYSLQEALQYLDTSILAEPDLHCWAVSKVTHASDPHWVENGV